jgi:glycine/D-amino acid oxidase-like deaminating enzyme
VIAENPSQLTALTALAAAQHDAGVHTDAVTDPNQYEPHLAPGLAGGIHYPQDSQLMPALAAAALLEHRNITVRLNVTVTAPLTSYSGRMIGVVTSDGHYSCGTVVNAAGAWAGELSTVLGAPIPVGPRRGIVLVTVPVPGLIRHKVYTGDYLAGVTADDTRLHTAPVIEGTPSGPILIGSSREHCGFDRTLPPATLRRLAAEAVALFPVLADVAVLRAYCGFRPYSPDHLPIIGPDPRLPGLWHATGHEGAGVGLAAATGRLLAQAITAQPTELDLRPFRPERFSEVPA